MVKQLLVLTALTLALTTGCSKDSAEPSQNETAAPATATAASGQAANAGHAAGDVEPGSHEDWCGEHAVPESQCTQCNPSLVAAFKATGDWCEEHGVPESQCQKCNPDLEIVRPPAAAQAEGQE